MMVKEYPTRLHGPGNQVGKQIEQNMYAKARVLADWKEKIKVGWPGLALYVEGQHDGQLSLGEEINVRAWVRADKLQPGDFSVEVVYVEAHDDVMIPEQVLPMEYIKKEQDG